MQCLKKMEQMEGFSLMKTTPNLSEKSALWLYILLTPLVSLAIALFLPLPTVVVVLFLLLVPSTLAILCTALAEGRMGLSGLARKLIQWRISFKWYLVAILMPVGIVLASGVAAYILGWSSTPFQINIPASSQLIFNFILVVTVAVLEELGWRGYALPRLLVYRSPLSSALIIGTLWGLLHIGVGLADGRPWLPSFLAPFGMSITLTWLFLHTRGSLAMAILFHFMVDYSPQFILSGLSIDQAVWSQAIANLAAALTLVLIYTPGLQRSQAKDLAAAEGG
jgi:membrane protease YdiL (CAAX protease family)